MRLGCNTILFNGADLTLALDGVAAAGYQYVELAAVPGMCEHLSATAQPRHLADVTRLLAKNGLTATAIEAALTDRHLLERIFVLANGLGIEIVNIGSGGVSGDEESTRGVISHIASLARLAGEFGITLAVKPHVGQAVFNSATATRLMNEVDEPALGLNFDPSHLFRAGEDPPTVAATWGKHIVASHIRDCISPEKTVGSPESQIPGNGVIDIPASLRALVDSGFDGPINLEVIGAQGYPAPRALQLATQARAYLLKLLESK